MKLNKLIDMAKRCWLEEHRKFIEEHRKFMSVPPEAKVVTGRPYQDAFLHHMLVKNGLELILNQTPKGYWVFVNHKVIDEQKYMMFVLRWS